jgi:hypothetical protein
MVDLTWQNDPLADGRFEILAPGDRCYKTLKKTFSEKNPGLLFKPIEGLFELKKNVNTLVGLRRVQ